MIDISSLTTLGTPTKAESVIEITSQSQITPDLSKTPYYILGTGANVLFKSDFPGNIVLIKLLGKKVVSQTDIEVLVEFAAGEIWHEAVMWTVNQNWSGMENMALIPGTIGAATVGNIAAYGQNQQDIMDHLTAINLETGKSETFSNSDCKFAYRESIFKNEFSQKYLVTSVTYKLSKIAHLELSYQATHHASLLSQLQNMHSAPYSISDISHAVISLRSAKLPDWTKIHTAGSFFKNPIVPKSQISNLKSQIPDLQVYPTEKLSYVDPSESENYVKIPAGMLLDSLGWRGKKVGKVGTYSQHALVIIADDGATGQEIFEFSQSMRADVHKNFGINLEYEVVII